VKGNLRGKWRKIGGYGVTASKTPIFSFQEKERIGSKAAFAELQIEHICQRFRIFWRRSLRCEIYLKNSPNTSCNIEILW